MFLTPSDVGLGAINALVVLKDMFQLPKIKEGSSGQVFRHDCAAACLKDIQAAVGQNAGVKAGLIEDAWAVWVGDFVCPVFCGVIHNIKISPGAERLFAACVIKNISFDQCVGGNIVDHLKTCRLVDCAGFYKVMLREKMFRKMFFQTADRRFCEHGFHNNVHTLHENL